MVERQSTAKQPLVSVVVPVYNGERFLRETLESIFAQDYHPYEVIVVDDGSVDASAEVAQSFEGVRYFYQENQGPAVARNTGIAAARGEFIAFLDADDLWPPEKLRLQVAALQKRPKLGYVLTKMRSVLEEGMAPPHWLEEGGIHEDVNGMLPSSLLVRKSVFSQVGLFDPAYRLGDDIDWFIRAHEAGIAMDVVPTLLLLRRIHGANMSSARPPNRGIWLRILRGSLARKRASAAQTGARGAQ